MNKLDLYVEKMAAEGKALARHGRFVVFIEGALPGERVRVDIYRKKKNYAFARVVELLEPAPVRLESPCSVFGQCGGCVFLNCEYRAQINLKQDVLRENLYGLVSDQSIIKPIMACESPFYYRNKMVYSFGMDDGQPQLGMHRRGSFHEVADASGCLLQSEESHIIVQRVVEFVRDRHIPIFDELSKEGALRSLMIREGKNTNQRMIQLITTVMHDELKNMLTPINELCNTFVISLDRHVCGPPRPEEHHLIKGSGYIEERMNNLRFNIGTDTFFQTNTRQAERMFAVLMSWMVEQRIGMAVDLYAGTGPIAMHMAQHADHVIAIESNEASVIMAERNIADNRLTNIEMQCAAIEKAPDNYFPEQADLLVVDPPRAGLHKKALSTILKMAPNHLFYVSCNPATLARDVKKFIDGGYGIDCIQPVDMFPHTFHLETLVRMRRA